MEILRLSGYSEEEKTEIAKRYLIPRQLTQTGLSPEQVQITDPALKKIISAYTREADVRRLEQTIGRVIRNLWFKSADGAPAPFQINLTDITERLAPKPSSHAQ